MHIIPDQHDAHCYISVDVWRMPPKGYEPVRALVRRKIIEFSYRDGKRALLLQTSGKNQDYVLMHELLTGMTHVHRENR